MVLVTVLYCSHKTCLIQVLLTLPPLTINKPWTTLEEDYILTLGPVLKPVSVLLSSNIKTIQKSKNPKSYKPTGCLDKKSPR
jgi:hypothetical protein